MLTTSKLISIENIINKALTDSEISYEKDAKILKEEEKYHILKRTLELWIQRIIMERDQQIKINKSGKTKKSIFIKEQEAHWLLKKLRIKTPLTKIPLLCYILFYDITVILLMFVIIN